MICSKQIVASLFSAVFVCCLVVSPLKAQDEQQSLEDDWEQEVDRASEFFEPEQLFDDSIITATTEKDESAEPVIQELKTDWRDGVGVLTIGYLIEGDEKRQRRQLEPFRLALQRASGLKVAYRAVRTLDQMIKLQAERRLQYALHSASSYITLQALCKCVEPLAVPKDQEGALGVHAVVIAPFSGKVRALSDLKGNRLAVPAPPATITRLLPLKNFKEAGYDKPDDIGELIDVANPVEGWRKVVAGKADAIIGWSSLQGDLKTGYSSGTLNHLITVTERAKSTDMRVVWQSKKIPNAPHVIRADVPTPLKELLRDFLTNLHEKNRAAYDAISPVLSGGFTLIEEKDFSPLAKVIEKKKEG